MKKHFVIIGGGYTGLAAAYRLAKQGFTVTVLERGNSLGGLASDFTIEGASLERAYHHIFKTDIDIIGLAEELGVASQIQWHDSSVSIYYNDVLYPFKGALDLIKFKPLTFINRIRAGLVVLYLQKQKRWRHFQHISAYEWMRKYAGKQVTEVIWEPLLKGKFDTYFDKVAMAWLWARIHTRAQSRETGGEKLGYFDGGFQVFTDALVAELARFGVTLKTGVKINAISNTNDSRVKISYEDKKPETYDKCIVTTPSHVFAKLIETSGQVKHSYIRQLKSINYLGARILIFSSNQDLSPYYWHNINDLNLPFLVFINHTKLVDKKHYKNKYIYYLATYVPVNHELFTCTEKELENIWFASLKKIFSKFDKKQVREIHTFTFANAQHIVDLDYAQKIPHKVTPMNNVYLSNFAQIFPEDRGTNFAIRDGLDIAEIAMHKLPLTDK